MTALLGKMAIIQGKTGLLLMDVAMRRERGESVIIYCRSFDRAEKMFASQRPFWNLPREIFHPTTNAPPSFLGHSIAFIEIDGVRQ